MTPFLFIFVSIFLNVILSKDLECIPVVMAGYDVVHYYSLSLGSCNSIKGSYKHHYNLNSTDQNGIPRFYQFWFSTQTNLDIFAQDPWSYAPRNGGFCSYGTCCEKNGWPWSSEWLGPPAGPDPKECGFRVHTNGHLYFNIWNSYDSRYFQLSNGINDAQERWIQWFGSLKAGVFNYKCFSSEGYSYMDCVYTKQDMAPIANRNPDEYCVLPPYNGVIPEDKKQNSNSTNSITSEPTPSTTTIEPSISPATRYPSLSPTDSPVDEPIIILTLIPSITPTDLNSDITLETKWDKSSAIKFSLLIGAGIIMLTCIIILSMMLIKKIKYGKSMKKGFVEFQDENEGTNDINNDGIATTQNDTIPTDTNTINNETTTNDDKNANSLHDGLITVVNDDEI